MNWWHLFVRYAVALWAIATASALPAVQLPVDSLQLVPTVNVSSQVVTDGISLLNPKAAPGAVVEYAVAVTSASLPPEEQYSLIIANPVPASLSLFVGDLGSNGSGPFVYEIGSNGSGFDCSFSSLSSMTDCVEFSNNGGSSFDYQPTPDDQGFDADVTHVRFRVRPTTWPLLPLISNFILRYRMRMEQ